MTVPPVGKGLLGVDDEAEEGLAEASGASLDEQELVGVVLTELDALAGARAAHELDRLLGDLLERDDLAHVGLRAGEAEQGVRDALDLEAALLNERQPFVGLRAGLDLSEQQLDEAEHAEKRVVDLVRHAADELSEPGQPTGFEESLPFRVGRLGVRGQG